MVGPEKGGKNQEKDGGTFVIRHSAHDPLPEIGRHPSARTTHLHYVTYSIYRTVV
jgi:hypothetical protein